MLLWPPRAPALATAGLQPGHSRCQHCPSPGTLWCKLNHLRASFCGTNNSPSPVAFQTSQSPKSSAARRRPGASSVTAQLWLHWDFRWDPAMVLLLQPWQDRHQNQDVSLCPLPQPCQSHCPCWEHPPSSSRRKTWRVSTRTEGTAKGGCSCSCQCQGHLSKTNLARHHGRLSHQDWRQWGEAKTWGPNNGAALGPEDQ